MSKCKDCNSDMITMSGEACLEVDDEPYIEGVEEKSVLQDVKIYVCAEYCEKCDKAQWINEQ